MRVAHLTESYAPIRNGVATSVATLARELMRVGVSPVIVAPRYPTYDDSDAWPVRRLRAWRTALNPDNPFAYPPLAIPKALEGARFDLVHTHQPFGIGLQGLALALRQRIPLVSTFHTLYTEYGHYIPFAPTALIRSVVQAHLRAYYNRCAAVITPSRFAANVLIEIGVTRPIHVVPTGVPPAVPVSSGAIEQARVRWHLPPDASVVLYVGRLAREKNLETLLAAFALVGSADKRRANAPNVHQRFHENTGRTTGGTTLPPTKPLPYLLLVGGGPHQTACQGFAAQGGIAERVRFTGYLTPDALPPLYALATLFALPATSETQGIVLTEAQRHGLPCVVANGGGGSEFVRDGVDALVVPPMVDDFADALARLLTDAPTRHQMGMAARASTLCPIPAEMAERMLAVYGYVNYSNSG